MYNKVLLVGRMVDLPELKTTPSGKNVCNFRLAVNRPYKEEDGSRKADFVSCFCWGKNGENIAAYFDKGDPIGIDGSFRSRDYTDKEGIKRYIIEVDVEQWFFTEGKKKDAEVDR